MRPGHRVSFTVLNRINNPDPISCNYVFDVLSAVVTNTVHMFKGYRHIGMFLWSFVSRAYAVMI